MMIFIIRGWYKNYFIDGRYVAPVYCDIGLLLVAALGASCFGAVFGLGMIGAFIPFGARPSISCVLALGRGVP